MFSSRSQFCMVLTMSAVLCIADYANAQRGGRGMGRMFGNSMSALLRNDQVRDELELVDDQMEELEEMNQEMREEMMGMFRGQGMRDMDEEERRQAMEEVREKINVRMKEMDEQVEDMLLPHQFDRLKQLHFQREVNRDGVKGLGESEVIAEALGITDEQKKELKETAEKTAKKLEEKMKELRKQAEEEILSVLTKEQRDKFKELRGESFEFDENDGGRGGDRGDRGGGGRERGGRGERGERRGPPPPATPEGGEKEDKKDKSDF